MFLIGDIGGTKTDLAIYSPDNDFKTAVAQERYVSDDYDSLAAMCHEFLKKSDAKIEAATFAVAGPVANGKAHVTNLPWDLSEKELSSALKISSVYLLNDLEAIAWAVPALGSNDLETLRKGERSERGAIAVIAPGTGLGQAFLTWNNGGYRAHSSEGGHADFAPNDADEAGLLAWLQKKYGHVSYERVCSGMGFPNIYDYLLENGFAQENADIKEQVANAEDRTPILMNAVLDADHPCKLCKRALEIFVSALGAAAGNLVLHYNASGGVYLGGGLPPRILSALKEPRFLEAFSAKGRLSSLAKNSPVHVIKNGVSLLGAIRFTLANHHHSPKN